MDILKASPQVEDGYIQIANELMDAMISYPFKNSELKIVLTIIRKTYGWKKKKEQLSFLQISGLAKVSMRHTKRVIKRLVLDNIVLKEKMGNNNVLGLNKDYCSWRLWKTLNPGDKIVTGKMTG